MQPTLRLRPRRPAVANDASSNLDLLLTIAAPSANPNLSSQRPPLNLALVIDRSGSMQGRKLSYARKAARFLASELTPRDRLSIVVFDHEVSVLMPSLPVHSPERFIEAINTIHSGGMTALHDGWIAGARQVAEHLQPGALNRVLLLSDGHTNKGLVDSDQIAEQVAGLAERGVSTSAFGLGDGFDEDLMGAIANAGQGTLAFIESPDDLPQLYSDELSGLNSTFATQLRLTSECSTGVEIVDVLNDLPSDSRGRLKLPNLRFGQELQVAVRLSISPWQANRPIGTVQLEWQSAAEMTSEPTSLTSTLTLPVMPHKDIQGLAEDTAVAEQFALMQATRDRHRAIDALDRGDMIGAQATLGAISTYLDELPSSDLLIKEQALITKKKELLAKDKNLSRKLMRSEAYRTSTDVWEKKKRGR